MYNTHLLYTHIYRYTRIYIICIYANTYTPTYIHTHLSSCLNFQVYMDLSTYPSKPSIHPYVHHLTKWRTGTIRNGDSLWLLGTELAWGTGGTFGPCWTRLWLGRPLPSPAGSQREEHLHSSTLTVTLAAPRKRGVDRHSLLGSEDPVCGTPRHRDRGTLRSPLEKLAGGNQPWEGGGLGYSRKEGCPEW